MTRDRDERVEQLSLTADEVVQLGNQVAEQDEEADLWDISEALLAGAIQFWLYAHEPCEEPDCQDCEPVSTAQRRLQLLLDQVKDLAVQSDYYHSPNDEDVGRA